MPGKTEISQTSCRLVSSPDRRQKLKAEIDRLGPRALMFSLAVVAYPAAASAGECGDRIARLEAARTSLGEVPYARQSVGAQLHHQPTPGAVANAESEARERLGAALIVARKLNSGGKEQECLAALEKAGVPLGAP